MKFLKKRPRPPVDSYIKVKRVHGGYIVYVGPQCTGIKYYGSEQIICKCLHEVLLAIETWSKKAVKEIHE